MSRYRFGKLTSIPPALSSLKVCLTNMTFASVARDADEQLALFDSADPEGRRFAAKCLEMRRRISEARRLVTARRDARRRTVRAAA